MVGSALAELTAEELDVTELLDDQLEIDDELSTEDEEIAMDELALDTEVDDTEDCDNDELLAPLYSMGNSGFPWSEFFCVSIQL